MSKLEHYLERIAVALERIADRIDSNKKINYPDDLKNFSLRNEPIKENLQENPLVDFLANKNIKIKSIPQEEPADSIIDSLSIFLGDRYNALSKLLAKIKRAMPKGESFSENISSFSQYDISSICQFCTRLYEIAFLEEYKYKKSPHYIIHIKTTMLPKAQKFFSGQWLERFAVQKIKSIFNRLKLEFNKEITFYLLLNPQIIMPNGDDFELDILCYMEGKVYWIEAKTGDYQQHISKYSKFSKLLNLDSNHSIMLLTDIPESSSESLSSLFSMSVCNLNNFEDYFSNLLHNDLETWNQSNE